MHVGLDFALGNLLARLREAVRRFAETSATPEGYNAVNAQSGLEKVPCPLCDKPMLVLPGSEAFCSGCKQDFDFGPGGGWEPTAKDVGVAQLEAEKNRHAENIRDEDEVPLSKRVKEERKVKKEGQSLLPATTPTPCLHPTTSKPSEASDQHVTRGQKEPSVDALKPNSKAPAARAGLPLLLNGCGTKHPKIFVAKNNTCVKNQQVSCSLLTPPAISFHTADVGILWAGAVLALRHGRGRRRARAVLSAPRRPAPPLLEGHAGRPPVRLG